MDMVKQELIRLRQIYMKKKKEKEEPIRFNMEDINNPLDVKKEYHSKLSKFSQQDPLYVKDNH